MSGQIIVLQGVSGAGKSSYAAKLAEAERRAGRSVLVVSADHHFMRKGVYTFDASKLSEAHGACFARFIHALRAYTDLVIVDNTNTTAVEIAPYMLGASAYGYDASVHSLAVDLETATARTVHGVSAASIDRQAESLRQGREALPPWWVVRTIPQSVVSAVVDGTYGPYTVSP